LVWAAKRERCVVINLPRKPFDRPPHKPYPPHKELFPRRKNPMTIAIGLNCVNSIIVAADTELSTGYTKSSGAKIFSSRKRDNFTILTAGSGAIDLIEMVSEKIDDALPDDAEFPQIKNTVESVLVDIYSRNLSVIPEYRDDLFLIFAVWTKSDGLHMLKAINTILTNEKKYACVGSGAVVASHLADIHYYRGIPTELARIITVYILKIAKRYSLGCGGETIMLTLKDDGKIHIPRKQSLRRLETVLDNFLIPTGYLFSCLSLGVTDEEVDKAARRFLNPIKKYRNELKKKRKKAIAGGKDTQSSKTISSSVHT
jgi:20S proteasome alpha/beta subunit